jgi:hypothetical protein
LIAFLNDRGVWPLFLLAGAITLQGCDGSSGSSDFVVTGTPYTAASLCDGVGTSAPGSASSGTSFSNVSELIQEDEAFSRGQGEGYGGLAWLDYDQDDDLDLFLTNETGYSSALLRNNGDCTFTNVSVEASAAIMTGNSGVVVGDIDNDGYPDIFLSGTGFFAGPVQSATVLLHNQGDGTFADISATAGVPGAETALSAAFGDINNDGYIDLFVSAQGHLVFIFPPQVQHVDKLYLNNGDLTFEDISVSSGANGGEGSCVASFSHFDDDEYIDLFVGVCNAVNLAPTPWHVYRNRGDNTFEDVAAFTRLDKRGYWMSSTFGDIDNDGDFDIFATNLGGSNTHHLWRNNGDGTYVDIAPDNGDGQDYWAWGATFADFDNDRFQDIYYVGELPGGSGTGGLGRGNRGYFFFNNGNSRFTVDNAALDLDMRGRGATGLSNADFDGDGFVEFAIMTSPTGAHPVAEPVLMRNNGNDNNSLTIQLEGTDSNRMGIGARVEVISPDGTFQAREIWAGSSFVSSESPWPVFGLGDESSAEVTVYWPSGRVETFGSRAAGYKHYLVEGGGSPL